MLECREANDGSKGQTSMTRALRFLVSLALIPTCAVLAQSHASGDQGDRLAGPPSWEGLMESMTRMHAAMSSTRPSADADADFVALMLPHHQAAIDMARVELVSGKDPQVRRLAQEILADQESEIQLMQLWQQQHRKEQ